MARNRDKQSTWTTEENREAQRVKQTFTRTRNKTGQLSAEQQDRLLCSYKGEPHLEAVPQFLLRCMEVYIFLLKYCLSSGKTKSNKAMKIHTMVLSAASKQVPDMVYITHSQ